AILAIQRGVKHVLAVDYDEVCVESEKENSVLDNTVPSDVELGSGERIKGKVCDIILANINRNIVIDQLRQYGLSTKSGGELYISGFDDGEDLEMLIKKAQSVGFDYQHKKMQDR